MGINRNAQLHPGQTACYLGSTPWQAASASCPTGPAIASPLARVPGMVDQLQLSTSAPPSPAVPPPLTPSFQLPGLSDLLHRLEALIAGLFSPSTPSAPPTSGQRTATKLVLSSFNVLGSQHTAPGGDAKGYDPGTVRIRRAAQLLDAHDVDVVGFQELQPDQLREFQKVAGDRYAVYPGVSVRQEAVKTSIAWRKDRWELIKPSTIDIPFLDGRICKMPVVLLRNRQTGQEAYFTNFHNAARAGQQRWRDEATRREIDLVTRLEQQTGLPVFVTGDMNESAHYYDQMTRNTDMVAANSGPQGQPPRRMGIDWIFGSPGVTFSGYTRDRSPLEQQTSDHAMIVSHARIDGRPA